MVILASALIAIDAQPSPTEPALDPAVPTGIALTALGSVGLIAGGVLLATAPKEGEACVPSGRCYPVDDEQRSGGAMLLAAGAGLASVGLPVMLGGLLSPHPHLSDARMVTGIVFVGLAAAHTAMAIAYPIEVEEHFSSGEGTRMLGWASAGAGFLAIGLPVLVSGAQAPTKSREHSPPQSPAMANAGYALLATSGVITSAGSLWFLLPAAGVLDCDSCGIDVFMSAVTLLSVGATLTITAIPLIVVGRRREEPPTFNAVPSLHVGPGSAQMGWSF